MTTGFIKYRSDYKYQLASDYRIQIPIRPAADIDTEFIRLATDGELTVKKGYAWDGPSGPVIDTKKNLRAALVHDALYQLMRNAKLNKRTHRKSADEIFRDICKEDGISGFRANVYYKALRNHGESAASPENKKKVHRAPPL